MILTLAGGGETMSERVTSTAPVAAAFLALGAGIAARLIGNEDDVLTMLAVGGFTYLTGQAVGTAIGRNVGQTQAVQTINGLKRQMEVANVRLDAAGAPPAPIAEAIVAEKAIGTP